MTKANRMRHEQYKRAYATTLDEIYTSYSGAKFKAFNDCICDCSNLNGYQIRVFGANTYGFNCAFLYDVDGTTHLRYHTRCHVYDFEIDE